jgi:serine/threonine protein kinase
VDGATEEELRRVLGQHAPQFTLGPLLGRGATGFVFRARETPPGRDVALKVLSLARSRDPAFAERFAREAQALERLVHPNVVAVYGHGQAGEHGYLVLELVDGRSLREELAAGPLAPKRALGIVAELCVALEFAHERGIVHRDVKPENVLLDHQGRVKVADFGTARILGDEAARASLTETGHALGTLRYMAPEQLERPLEVDQRADVYALGVVFYEMLTGEIPMGRFVLPSQKALVDERLDEIVLHALDRDPKLRYRSAGEVRRDLERIAAGKPTRSEPRVARRFSWLAVLSCVIAILAANSVVAAFFSIAGSTSKIEGSSDSTGVHLSEPVRTQEPILVPVLLVGLWSLIAMALPLVLSRASLDRIRAQWPKLYGVGAAMTGAWFVPLVGLNCAIAIAIDRFILEPGFSMQVVPYTMLCLVLDSAVIGHRRRRFLRELG